MKKIVSGVIALVMLFTFVSVGASIAEAKKLSVVTTIFPVYDWVREVVGEHDNVGITMLLDNGVDLHSYQPTARDIMKIATCDVFVYVGGESDEWVEDALGEAVNPNMVVVNLMEALGGPSAGSGPSALDAEYAAGSEPSAFSGCSAESEASFETIVFLAGKVDELGLSTVLTIEGDNHRWERTLRIAETIVGNTQAKDAKVLAMDSMQATTGNDAKNGATYLGAMEANLEALKRALTK